MTTYFFNVTQILLVVGGLNWLTVPLLYSSGANSFAAGACQPYDLLYVVFGDRRAFLFFVYIAVGIASLVQIGLTLFPVISARCSCSLV